MRPVYCTNSHQGDFAGTVPSVEGWMEKGLRDKFVNIAKCLFFQSVVIKIRYPYDVLANIFSTISIRTVKDIKSQVHSISLSCRIQFMSFGNILMSLSTCTVNTSLIDDCFNLREGVVKNNNHVLIYLSIVVMSHERHGIIHNWQLNCLLKSVVRLTAKETSNLRITGPLWRESTVTTRCQRS